MINSKNSRTETQNIQGFIAQQDIYSSSDYANTHITSTIYSNEYMSIYRDLRWASADLLESVEAVKLFQL